ncbi:penicillin acylase family protein [Rapidithrix thailandica]|uniref:Penicillin acylase family protein n=1 Tax=Rapidithrix thailandica TaxID=413964 RepID=A0AAW9SIK8_9BACT
MKRIAKSIVLISILAGWLYCITASHSGLNALVNIASYHNGLLSLKPLTTEGIKDFNDTPAKASVYIDSLGIPHIFAEDNHSLGYSLGYMHARERYFQMELIAHTAMGRLAEIIGDPGLGSDTEWRPFLFEEKARKTYEELAQNAPELHSYLSAYAQGVNAYLSTERTAYRDPLYLIWGYEPQPWKPSYTFLIQWYLSAQLSYYTDYLDRQEILEKVPKHIRQYLYPTYPKDQRFIIPPQNEIFAKESETEKNIVSIFGTDQPHRYTTRPAQKSLGSNNWAIAPPKTMSGKTLLCNDPHLALTAPQVFYEVQLHTPELKSYGYTIPGSPVIVSGHNTEIAWGITNGGWDVTEMYVLKTDEKAPQKYFYEGHWLTTESKKFTLNSKGQSPYEFTAEFSELGKVIREENLTYAIYWHPQQGSKAVQAFWNIMKATNWNGFTGALRQYDHPAQNFAYADRKGNIGMVSAGKMPLKPQGYAGGLLDGTRKPIGKYLSFDSLPQVYNPSRHYVFSANQEPMRGPHYFASHWFDDLYRPRRIDNLLAAGKHFDIEDMIRLQSDVKDLMVEDIQQLLMKYLPEKQKSNGWNAFIRWNGELTPGSEMNTRYQALRKSIDQSRNDIASKLHVKAPPTPDQFLHFLKTRDEIIIGEQRLISQELINEIAKRAETILKQNEKQTSGAANPFAFEIPQMTMLPGFSIPVTEVGGSENTINVNYGAFPVIRTIIALDSSGVQSWMVTAGGQSGRVNSKTYLQQLPNWIEHQPHRTQTPEHPGELRQISCILHFKKK